MMQADHNIFLAHSMQHNLRVVVPTPPTYDGYSIK